MLKLSLFFIFSVFTVVQAQVNFDELIKKNIDEQNNLATDVQKYAGVESQEQKKSKNLHISAENQSNSEFTVKLKKKSKNKNPVNCRSIASESNRDCKKPKKKKEKKLTSVSSIH